VEEVEKKAQWILILFPGFLSMWLVGQIVNLGELNDLETIFIAILFNLIDVSVAIIACRLFLNYIARDTRARIDGLIFAVTVLLISTIVGIAAGLAAERDLFFVVLRSLPLTNTLNKRSSAAPLTFLLTQNSGGELTTEGDARPKPEKVTEAFVRIGLKDGRVYEGWPEFYSLSAENGQIYLSPACVYVDHFYGTSKKKISGPGVVLTLAEVSYVEFVDRKASSCFLMWYPSQPKSGPARP
jgi:hypothetical protein